jgi:hypothetical protein
MGCGWWVERRRLSQSSRKSKQFEQIAKELSEAIDSMGGKAIYWYGEDRGDYGVKVIPPDPLVFDMSASNEGGDDQKSNTEPPLPRIEAPL